MPDDLNEPERPCLCCGTDPGDCLAEMNRSPAQVRCCHMCGINDMHSADAHHRIAARLDALTEPQREILDRMHLLTDGQGNPGDGFARSDLDGLIAVGLVELGNAYPSSKNGEIVRRVYHTTMGGLVLEYMYRRAQEEAGAGR